MNLNFSNFISHMTLFFLLKSLRKKKRKIVFRHEKEILQTCFSPGKIRFPNVFTTLVWSNSPARTVFFFYTQYRSPSEKNSLRLHMTSFFLLYFIFFTYGVTYNVFKKIWIFFHICHFIHSFSYIWKFSWEKCPYIFTNLMCPNKKSSHITFFFHLKIFF